MESKKHHLLVIKINEYVREIKNIEEKLIESDIFEVAGNVTRMPEGFIPDLFYKYNNVLIIGEAKTDEDLEKEHSFRQYESYCNYIKENNKAGVNCIFVLAVPWEATKTALKICKRIFADVKVKFVIMNELGVYKEYEKNNIK